MSHIGGDLVAEDANAATISPDESEQGSHQRCLAGAVGAQQSMELPADGDQVNTAKDIAIPITFRDTDGLEGDRSSHGAGC